MPPSPSLHRRSWCPAPPPRSARRTYPKVCTSRDSPTFFGWATILDFLCVDAFLRSEQAVPGHRVFIRQARSGRAVCRRVQVLHLALFLQRVVRLKTFDDIDNTSSFHNFLAFM